MNRYVAAAVVMGAAAFISGAVAAASPPADPVGEFVAWAQGQGYAVESPACATAGDGAITCYAIETSGDDTRVLTRVLYQGQEYPDVWVGQGAFVPAVSAPAPAASTPGDPVSEFVAWAASPGYAVESPACAVAGDGAITCYAIETSGDDTRVLTRVLWQGQEYPEVYVREGQAAAPVPTSAAPVPTSAAPVPTSAAPVPTSAAPVPTSAAPAPTVVAPSATVAAPIEHEAIDVAVRGCFADSYPNPLVLTSTAALDLADAYCIVAADLLDSTDPRQADLALCVASMRVELSFVNLDLAGAGSVQAQTAERFNSNVPVLAAGAEALLGGQPGSCSIAP